LSISSLAHDAGSVNSCECLMYRPLRNQPINHTPHAPHHTTHHDDFSRFARRSATSAGIGIRQHRVWWTGVPVAGLEVVGVGAALLGRVSHLVPSTDTSRCRSPMLSVSMCSSVRYRHGAATTPLQRVPTHTPHTHTPTRAALR
jgi:hypothetical protein